MVRVKTVPMRMRVFQMLLMMASLFTILMGTVVASRASEILDTPELREINKIRLHGGIEIILPAKPIDPIAVAAFESLTPSEQIAFYKKRAWIVQKMTSGLAKPGIGSAVRWTKEKVTYMARGVRSKFSHADHASGEAPAESFTASETTTPSKEVTESLLEFERVPENMTERTRNFVDAAVSSLVQNMWANSVGIARSSGIGISLVAGSIWNTTAGKWGFIDGRSLSIDIGADFENNRGYVNFFKDYQSKSQGGFSIDVGLMFDAFLHFTDPKLEVGTVRLAQHQKLPLIGSFRGGPNYKGWGLQMGVHVVEIGAIVATFLGYPEAGASAIALTRTLGYMTIYRTNLESRLVKSVEVPPDHWLLKKLGLAKLFDIMGTVPVRTCRSLFAPTAAN